MVKLLRVDFMVSGLNLPSVGFRLELGESPALNNSRHMNHEVGSHREEEPEHCSISKKLLSVKISVYL